MRRLSGMEIRLKKAACFAIGLLLAVAAMIFMGVAEGTPEPGTPPSLAPRPAKWSHS